MRAGLHNKVKQFTSAHPGCSRRITYNNSLTQSRVSARMRCQLFPQTAQNWLNFTQAQAVSHITKTDATRNSVASQTDDTKRFDRDRFYIRLANRPAVYQFVRLTYGKGLRKRCKRDIDLSSENGATNYQRRFATFLDRFMYMSSWVGDLICLQGVINFYFQETLVLVDVYLCCRLFYILLHFM
jgi:hypothetical protein